MARLPAHLHKDIRLIEVHSHTGITLKNFTQEFPFCRDLRTSFEDNERIGVTHAVVFPFCSSLYYDVHALRQAEVKTGGGVGLAALSL